MKNIVERVLPIAGLAVLGIFLILILSIVRTSVFGEVEPEKHIYFEIVFLLLLAVLGELAVVYTKQPSVMILMLLGLLLSPSFMDFAWDILIQQPFLMLPEHPPEILKHEDVLHVFAQLGAVILLFKVGMHNRLEKIFALDNLVVAIAGILVPFAVGYLYASMTGGNFAYSMFMAAALTATSVGVTVAILKEFGLLKERFAQIIIGAAVIDDILGLLVLSLVINVTGPTTDVVFSLGYTLATAALFLLGAVLAGKYVIEYLDRKELSARRLLIVLAFVLFYAYVAEFLKLSAIVGAFMAGIILANSKHHAQIEDKTYGLELLFMPIFFISLGALIDFGALFEFAVPILIITVLAIISKFAPCFLASVWARLKPIDAALVGAGMAPRGEVALIVASIGISTGILTAPEYSVIASMALLTTFAVPPMMQHLLAKRMAEAKT